MADKRNIYNVCSIIGIIACLIYFIFMLVGKSNTFLVWRILLATVASIVASIRMGIQLSNDEPYENSVTIIFFYANLHNMSFIKFVIKIISTRRPHMRFLCFFTM